jgi:tRNA wybutosine-synthesizing protein 3
MGSFKTDGVISTVDPWKAYREHHLRRLKEAKERGEVDIPIIPLLDLLNTYPNIVTTSSCSGRIILLATDENESKAASFFHRKWHRPVMVEEVLEGYRSFQGEVLWFKQDPFIIHFATRDLKTAVELVSTARRAGIKIAGVQVFKGWRFHVEVRGIDALSVPIYWKRPLINEEYLKNLTLIANKKLVKNQTRMEKLYREWKETLKNLHTDLFG